MNTDTQKRVVMAQAGLLTSRVDMRAGLVASLAGSPGYRLDQWLAATFNHNFDAYDKAIDAAYNATRVGGSQLHHLVDQQHSLLGALGAVKGVAADDGFARELVQASEHLLRDTASVSGTNVLYSVHPDTFGHVSNLVAPLGITKSYLADAMTLNGSELLGGALGIAAAIVVGKKGKPGDLSRLAGAMLLSSMVSANPLLFGAAGLSLLYACKKGEERRQCLRQAGKGALVSGAVLVTTHVIGGPIWFGCLVGMATAIVAGKIVDDPAKAYERMQQLIKSAQAIYRAFARTNTMVDG